MSEDSQDRKVTVPTVFINGKAYPLTGEYQINEEDVTRVLDEINNVLAENIAESLRDLQKSLPMIGQFFQNQKFIPRIEGNFKGNLRLKFNERTLVNLNLPNFSYPDDEEDEE